MADCRKCVFFVGRGGMDAEQLEECEILAARRGERCLGWCRRFERPVTHYVGRCWGFRNKKLASPSTTLVDFYPQLRDAWGNSDG